MYSSPTPGFRTCARPSPAVNLSISARGRWRRRAPGRNARGSARRLPACRAPGSTLTNTNCRSSRARRRRSSAIERDRRRADIGAVREAREEQASSVPRRFSRSNGRPRLVDEGESGERPGFRERGAGAQTRARVARSCSAKPTPSATAARTAIADGCVPHPGRPRFRRASRRSSRAGSGTRAASSVRASGNAARAARGRRGARPATASRRARSFISSAEIP